MSSNALSSSRRDHSTTTADDEDKIELQEQDLNRVTGGSVRKAGSQPSEYLTSDLLT